MSVHYAFTEELGRQHRAELAATYARGSRHRAHNRPAWKRWIAIRPRPAYRPRSA